MSRIGKAPIQIPGAVKVNVKGDMVQVEGPKGKLSQSFHPENRSACRANCPAHGHRRADERQNASAVFDLAA